MNAKQFAWLYLIENGFTGVRPSYYGGWDLLNSNSASIYPVQNMFDMRDQAKTKIKGTGVDWSKTRAPESDSQDIFQGTFCDNKSKEFLTGKLVLKNGETQEWWAEAIDITNVFEMMAEADAAVHRAMELFDK